MKLVVVVLDLSTDEFLLSETINYNQVCSCLLAVLSALLPCLPWRLFIVKQVALFLKQNPVFPTRLTLFIWAVFAYWKGVKLQDDSQRPAEIVCDSAQLLCLSL